MVGSLRSQLNSDQVYKSAAGRQGCHALGGERRVRSLSVAWCAVLKRKLCDCCVSTMFVIVSNAVENQACFFVYCAC